MNLESHESRLARIAELRKVSDEAALRYWMANGSGISFEAFVRTGKLSDYLERQEREVEP